MGSVIMTSLISSLSCCSRSRPSRAQQHHTHQPNYESASECETETNLSRRAWSRLFAFSRTTKHDLRRGLTECTIQLSATDVLAPTSMKNAAKCDTSCELQNPVNHQNFERTLRFRDIPGSMPVGVSAHTPLTPLWVGQSNDSPVVRWNLSVALLYMLKWSVPRRVDLRIWNELFKTSGPVVSSSDRFALFTAGVVSSHEHHRQRVGRSLIRETEYTLWSSVARFPARTSKGCWRPKHLPSLH